MNRLKKRNWILFIFVFTCFLCTTPAFSASGDKGLSTAQQKQHLKQYKKKSATVRKPSARSSATKRNYAIRGLAAKQNLSKLSVSRINRAMNRSGMRTKNGSHVARRLRERGPRDGIHTLQHFTRALASATPNQRLHNGQPHTYYKISHETVLTVNARGQMTTVLTDKKLAQSLKW